MSGQDFDRIDEGFVLIANEILRKCKINGEVQSLKECSDSYFVAVYEGILGESLVGAVSNATSRQQKILNCENVIDALSHDVLNVDLSHITAENIVDGDIATIQNLLEIFKELLDFIIDVDDEFDVQDSDDQNDSNLLSSDHEVISHVLQEELGPAAYHERFASNMKNSRVLSSDASLVGEPELSSISNDIPSSRNSDIDSNSTDEILREADLLEQRVRDLAKNGQKNDKFEYKRYLGGSSSIPGTQHGGPRVNTVAMSGTEKSVADDEMFSKVVSERNGDVSEGMSGVTDRWRGTIRDDDGYRGDTIRDIDMNNGSHRGTFVPKTGTLGDNSNRGEKTHRLNSKPVEIPTGSNEEVCPERDSDEFSLSRDRTRDIAALTSKEKNNRSLATSRDSWRYTGDTNGDRDDEVRVRNGSLATSKGNWGYTKDKNNDPDDDLTVRNRSLATLNDNSGYTRHKKDDRVDKVRDKKESSMYPQEATNHSSVVAKPGSKAQRGATTSRLGNKHSSHKQKEKKYMQVSKTTEKSTGSRKSILGKARSEESSKYLDSDARREKSVQPVSRLRDSQMRRDKSESNTNTDVREDEMGKQSQIPRDIVRDQTKSTVKNTMKEKKVGIAMDGKVQSGQSRDISVPVEKRTGASQAIKEHTDGSESSGVFWDDQISPLDVSERFHRPNGGLAFDEVGVAKKSREYKTDQERGKKSRDSPVIRHYHHHFHHGSSEDLVRDVDANERSREIAGSKNLGRSRKEYEIKDYERTPKKRSVKFDDHVDTLLITNRLERLRQEMETHKENERRSKIRNGYNGYLDKLNKEHKRIEKELKQKPKRTKRVSPYRKKQGTAVVSRDRTQTNQRKARYPCTKARKSSSVSPKFRSNKGKAAKKVEKGDIILPTLLDEFPFLHVSPHTLQTMRRKQTQQIMNLSKSGETVKRQTKTQKVLEDAEKRQQTLLKILRKDLQHNQRMREQKDRNEQERAIKSRLREKRHASARARRYYEEYQLRMRARMLKRRTREEQIFKNLFEDGLEIQKQRVRELRDYAKEQREMRAVKQQNELESLENFYRDQYSMLAEAIAEEKEALLVREQAQEKVIQQMQRNLREKLQKEVTEIQGTLLRDEDDAYFRRLDAERLRRQLQMTSFQNMS